MKSIRKNTDYAPVYQNNALNEFSYLTDGIFRKKCAKDFYDSNGNIKISRDDVIFIFDSIYCQLNGRTQQFLFLLIERFTQRVPANASDLMILKNLSITMTFSEIAEEFSLSFNGAKKLAMTSATTLQFTTINAHWSDDRKEIARSINVLQSVRYEIDKLTKRGQITVTFSNDFARALTGMPIMWYPRALRRVSLKRFPSANGFAMRMAVMANMNYGKTNFGRVNVETLLNSTSSIPAYDELKKRQMQVHQRIISPVFCTLDALVDCKVLSKWQLEYKGDVVPKDKYSRIRYEMFKECVVSYEMFHYPEKNRRKALLNSTLRANPGKDKIINKPATRKPFREIEEYGDFYKFNREREWSEAERQRFYAEREKAFREADEIEGYNDDHYTGPLGGDVPF